MSADSDLLRYATVAMIYVREIRTYDHENHDEDAVSFCKRNGFSYLPSVDRRSIYRITDNGIQQLIHFDHLQCNPFDQLFDPENLISKFKKAGSDGVLFVMDKSKIKGVIHAVDYNHSFISIELFKLFIHFEKNLRLFLIKHRETNDSFIDWIRQQTESHFEKRFKELRPSDAVQLQIEEQKRLELSPFQSFYLSDILYFVENKFKLISRSEQYKIRDLRNWLMHSKDFIKVKGDVGVDPIYDLESLEVRVRQIRSFLDVFDRLQSHLSALA